MKNLKYVLMLLPAVLAAPQAMACFTVLNPANQIVYSGMTPPIDMSYQIHERLPAAFPGGHMIFGMDTDCPSIDRRIVSTEFSNVPGAVPPAVATGRRAPRADRQ
jgi:hypothetical protein